MYMYMIEAQTQGARWMVAGGFESRSAAERALVALLAHDGLHAEDASGRMVAVTFVIAAE